MRVLVLVLIIIGLTTSLGAMQTVDVTGVWAQLVVSSQLSDVPFAGRVRQQTISVQRVEIKKNRDALTLEAQTCALEFDSGTPLVQIRFPNDS